MYINFFFYYSDNGGNQTTVTVSLLVTQFRSVMFVSKSADTLIKRNCSFFISNLNPGCEDVSCLIDIDCHTTLLTS